MKNINPTFKTGIKTLSDVQIKNSLPGYDLLFSKLEEIRNLAHNMEDRVEINNSFDNLKYDNIFSILGGRGAGKTSVLLTIYHNLEEENKNILMPLIMPELVDDKDSFIGWILSSMEKNLKSIENEIEKKGNVKCNSSYNDFCKYYNFFDRCAFNRENILRKKFQDLKKSYYAKTYNHRKGNWDYPTDMALISGINDESFSLISKFTDYWNTLVDVIKQINDLKKDVSPLIFFMIDDADLKPDIINELIFCLPKYFSHPNVVVFVSASHKTLHYTVKNHMFQQITHREFDLISLMEIEHKYNNEIYRNEREYGLKKVRFQDLRYGREYDKIATLTEEILRKLFPINNRFYLKKYEKYDEKSSIIIEENGDCKKLGNILIDKLLDFKKDTIAIHTKKLKEKKGQTSKSDIIKGKKYQFAYLEKNKSKDISLSYFSFWGKYPRDIVGGYYAFCDLITELQKILDDFYETNSSYRIGDKIPEYLINGVYNTCTQFIKSIVYSNKNLKPFMYNSDNFIIQRKMHWQLYVDYPYVLSVMQAPEYIDENKKKPSAFIEMLNLLNLIEQVIVLVLPDRKNSHGHIEFIQILNICGIEMIKPVNDFERLIMQFNAFHSIDIVTEFNKNNTAHQDAFLDTVYKLNLFSEDENTNDRFKYTQWYDFCYKIMYYRFSIINQVKLHKKEIFILPFPTFSDHLYKDFYNTYRTKLLGCSIQCIRFENKNYENCQYIINEVQSTIIGLTKMINNATLSWFSDDFLESLDSFMRELGSAEGLTNLKMDFIHLVNTLKNHDYEINRLELINYLNRFRNYVDTQNYYFMNIESWVRRLSEMLEREMIFWVDDEEQYENYMSSILDNLDEYMNAIFTLCASEQTKKSIKGVSYFYDSIYLKTPAMFDYIHSLHIMEWNKIASEEIDYEE